MATHTNDKISIGLNDCISILHDHTVACISRHMTIRVDSGLHAGECIGVEKTDEVWRFLANMVRTGTGSATYEHTLNEASDDRMVVCREPFAESAPYLCRFGEGSDYDRELASREAGARVRVEVWHAKCRIGHSCGTEDEGRRLLKDGYITHKEYLDGMETHEKAQYVKYIRYDDGTPMHIGDVVECPDYDAAVDSRAILRGIVAKCYPTGMAVVIVTHVGGKRITDYGRYSRCPSCFTKISDPAPDCECRVVKGKYRGPAVVLKRTAKTATVCLPDMWTKIVKVPLTSLSF